MLTPGDLLSHGARTEEVGGFSRDADPWGGIAAKHSVGEVSCCHLGGGEETGSGGV